MSVMQALAGAVLLIACLNLANMMLATGSARQKEIAIRLAVGGSRFDVVRQLLIQGMMLSLIGGVAGLIVASWLMQGLLASMTTVLPLPVIFDMTPDALGITATLVFCSLATIGFGLLPALRLSRTDVAPTLKDQAGEIGGRLGARMSVRGALVTAQLALSLALLILSGLFVRAATAGRDANPGFDLEPLVLAEIDPQLGGYDDVRSVELRRLALERLRSTPGVASAAVATIIPFGNVSVSIPMQREGQRLKLDEPGARDKLAWAQQYVIGTDYFKTLGIGMVRGREFTLAEETGKPAARPVIIDTTLAAKLFPNEDPVGGVLQYSLDDVEDHKEPLQIIGVAPAVRHDLADVAPEPHVYLPTGAHTRSHCSSTRAPPAATQSRSWTRSVAS
jgi:hypothetical protein